jgi:hypothetical protein
MALCSLPTRSKGTNSRSTDSGGMPRPVSATLIRSRPPATGSQARCTLPPSRLYFTAFVAHPRQVLALGLVGLVGGRLGQAQLLLQGRLLGDVPGDQQDPAGGGQGPAVDVEGAPASVGVAGPQPHRGVLGLAGEHAPLGLGERLQVVGVDDVGAEGAATHPLAGRPAQDPLHRRAHGADAALGVQDGDDVGRGADDACRVASRSRTASSAWRRSVTSMA